MARKKRKKQENLKINAPLIFGCIAVILGGLVLMTHQNEGDNRPMKSTGLPVMKSEKVMEPKAETAEAKTEAAPKSVRPAGPDYNSLLADAVAQGSIESIDPLLESGASIDGISGRYAPPLIKAAGMGSEDMVAALLDRKAKMEVRDGDGRTALHRAVEGHHEKVAKLLIERGASIQDADKVHSLLVAAAGADKGMIKMLIEAGADVNAKVRSGDTPLLAVLKAGGKDAYGKAKFLVKKGAELDIKNNNGVSPLALAQEMDHARMVKLVTPEQE